MNSEKETLSQEIAPSPQLEAASEPCPTELRRLLRKIDLRVIPILALLYFLSFLDRGWFLSGAVFPWLID